MRTQHGPTVRRHCELHKHGLSRTDSVRRAATASAGDSAVMETFRTTIIPVLTIRQAARAVAFYQQAFGAEEIYRNTYPDGRIVAELAIDGARFRVADEAPEASNLSPQALNGTTVRINLLVADPDRFAEHALANGAIEIAPIADQSYGLRQGRLADPFGHHWLIGRPLAGESGGWARTPDP
jgi:PhnB protein